MNNCRHPNAWRVRFPTPAGLAVYCGRCGARNPQPPPSYKVHMLKPGSTLEVACGWDWVGPSLKTDDPEKVTCQRRACQRAAREAR